MKHLFAIGPWLMDLINPPPRASLSAGQKAWRIVLITVTLVSLCVISALLLSLGVFAWQRSQEVMEGIPQLRNAVLILLTSILVNAACIFTLLQVKKLDRRMIPEQPRETEGKLPPHDAVETAPPFQS